MNLYVESCTRVYRGLERGLLSKADTELVFGRVRNWRSREFGRSGSNCVGVWAERRGARAEVKRRPTFPPTTTRDQTTQQAQFLRHASIRLRACKPHNLVRTWSIWFTWPATSTQAVIPCLSLPHVRRYQVLWPQAAECFTTNIFDEDHWHAAPRYPVTAVLRVRLVHAHFRGL